MTSQNALETRNLALTSTFVVQGTCTGVVFAIGDKSVMGRIVSMSGETKFKLTTVQREVWFLTKIVSALALTVFCVAIIIWAAWLRRSYPGYETPSQAIVNSIGCLTSFVPQVRSSVPHRAHKCFSSLNSMLGSPGQRCVVPYHRSKEDGETAGASEELGDSRNAGLHVGALL